MMVNDTYYFRAINLNHSVEFRLKQGHRIQELDQVRYQLHFHIVSQVMLLNDQNPIYFFLMTHREIG